MCGSAVADAFRSGAFRGDTDVVYGTLTTSRHGNAQVRTITVKSVMRSGDRSADVSTRKLEVAVEHARVASYAFLRAGTLRVWRASFSITIRRVAFGALFMSG